MKNNNHKKRKNFFDPMYVILTALLLFLVIGTLIYLKTNNETIGTGIRIVLDSAYGGDAKGYEGIVTESEFNENVVSAIENKLKDDKRFTVIRSHDKNKTASDEDRINKINKCNADLVLSIHCASAADETIYGMNVYSEPPSSSKYETSLNFADKIVNRFVKDGFNVNEGYLYYINYGENAVQMEMVDASDITKREEKTWEMMEESDIPVVVIEQIYCTSQVDADNYANEEGYQKIADNYYHAILDMYGFENE